MKEYNMNDFYYLNEINHNIFEQFPGIGLSYFAVKHFTNMNKIFFNAMISLPQFEHIRFLTHQPSKCNQILIVAEIFFFIFDLSPSF